jgi:hypothetical protein
MDRFGLTAHPKVDRVDVAAAENPAWGAGAATADGASGWPQSRGCAGWAGSPFK